MHNINFEQYKVFYFVAKNLSFSVAAKELFISQSAVSQSIKNLETRIGTSLFIRKSKKIMLSHEGEILYESVKIAFSHITNGENSIIQYSDTMQRELKIAASDTISKYFLLPYIENFNSLHSNIKIKIFNRPSRECLEMLTNSDVDLALISHSSNILDPSIKSTKVFEAHDVFVAGPKYSYLKNRKLSIKDISEFPILALEGSASSRQQFNLLTKKYDIDIVPEIETQSMGLLKDLARIGLGIAYINTLAVSKTTDLFILDTDFELSTNYVSIATLKRNKLNKFTEEFIRLILVKI